MKIGVNLLYNSLLSYKQQYITFHLLINSSCKKWFISEIFQKIEKRKQALLYFSHFYREIKVLTWRLNSSWWKRRPCRRAPTFSSWCWTLPRRCRHRPSKGRRTGNDARASSTRYTVHSAQIFLSRWRCYYFRRQICGQPLGLQGWSPASVFFCRHSSFLLSLSLSPPLFVWFLCLWRRILTF